jgi:hypothetical protein
MRTTIDPYMYFRCFGGLAPLSLLPAFRRPDDPPLLPRPPKTSNGSTPSASESCSPPCRPPRDLFPDRRCPPFKHLLAYNINIMYDIRQTWPGVMTRQGKRARVTMIQRGKQCTHFSRCGANRTPPTVWRHTGHGTCGLLAPLARAVSAEHTRHTQTNITR